MGDSDENARQAATEAKMSITARFREMDRAADHPAKRVVQARVRPPANPAPPRPKRTQAQLLAEKETRRRIRRELIASGNGLALRPSPLKELPTHCLGCGLPMAGRGKGVKPNGRVLHASKGRCQKCYRATLSGVSGNERGTNEFHLPAPGLPEMPGGGLQQ